jgi:adenosylmethionine-8-amino-7-oxononanoate aminotransferase
MSVCDPITGMHHLFQTVLQQQLFANVPTPAYGQVFDEARDMQSIKELLHRHHPEIAGIILEPIVQGAGGMRFYAPEYLQKVRELCDEYEVLLIADEIATGFGRSGKLFALQHANITPDILCLGKALSGGYMSFAATLTTSHVAEVFRKGEAGVLMHGPTFMGNPLACAVSLASLNLLETATDWQRKVPAIERQLRQELEPCRESEYVRDVRVLGAIGVVELKEPVADMKTLQRDLVQHGVWLRPFGRLLYTMPPFIIEPHQLRKITRAMVNLTRRRL